MKGTFGKIAFISMIFGFAAQLCAAPAESPQTKTDTVLMLEEAVNSRSADAREAAEKHFLQTVETYLSSVRSTKGIYEDNLKARLKAIDSIWALGELGNPRLMSKLARFYVEADDVVKMNLIISVGKLEKNTKAGPYLFDIAANPLETEAVRSVAFEMLEHIGYPSTVINLQRSEKVGIEKADLIYTGGIVGTISGWFSPDLPIGHAGLFVGTEVKDGKIKPVITDCVPNNFKPGGVRNIDSWYNFTHHYKFPFYGNRTTSPRPTAEQRDAIAKLGLEMGAKGLKYNDSHFSQKGPEEFDCVGYTEFLYESIGLNPTDNSYETSWGWPLTPWEQFIAVKPNTSLPGPIVLPNNGNIITPSQAIITQGAAALGSAFGMDLTAAQPDHTAVHFEIVN